MEHRHKQRIACELDIELYRAGKPIGTATTLDISNDGIHIKTHAKLKRNERIDIVFLEKSGIPDWPDNERAMVAYVKDGHAGLWFGRVDNP